jgi:dTDP-glucose pyrophosphorylase
LEYVEQRQPEGIAHALGCLAGRVATTMVVSLGDIYFVADDLQSAVAPVLAGESDATLLSKRVSCRDEIKKNFEIHVTADGRVQRVVEKPAQPSCDIKGCGLYVFNQRIFAAIAQTPRSALRNEYELTDAIQVLVDQGAIVRHAPLIQTDINLTSPADLLTANLAELRRQDLLRLIGQRAQLHPAARITSSVLGPGVIVEQPIHIERSVILAESVLRQRHDLVQTVVGPAGVVSC